MTPLKQIGALVVRTFVSTILLSLLMYTFFACVDYETFVAVAEIATSDPIGTTWLFVPIVIVLCLSVMLCYLVVNPPKGDCLCIKKAEPVKEEKKTVAKKLTAKKAVKTTKKTSKK